MIPGQHHDPDPRAPAALHGSGHGFPGGVVHGRQAQKDQFLLEILGDRRVPRRSKILLGALLAYLAFPIDLVPDFIPVAGQLDDAILMALVLRSVLRSTGKDLLEEHWPGPRASLNVLMRFAYGSPA